MEMHSNMLAVYPELLKRVAAIDGVVAAKEVSELTQMIASGNAKRTVAPAVGAVYVIYGGHTPDGNAGSGKHQRNTLYFTLVYCGECKLGSRSSLYEVGKVLTSIKQAIQGWDPQAFVASPFVESNAPAIEYNDGYAFYPLSFTTTVSISAN